METRTFVTFSWSADVPFEADEDPHAPPPGRAIMEHLHGALASAGYTVSSVDQHSFYGWAIEVVAQETPIWLMLQYCEPWLIIAEPRLSLLDRLRGRKAREQTLSACMALHSTLGGAPATDIQWFTPDGFQRSKGHGGAPSPVAA